MINLDIKNIVDFVVGLVIGGGISFYFTRNYFTKKLKQTQKSGDNCINNQFGRDFNLKV